MHKEATAMQYGKSDWDEVRLAFYNSIMVDSQLNSLAQNAELGDWPIERASETPSKYVDFSWEEIHELPDLADHPERIELLITILKDTLSFDDPFGDMVETVETATDQDDALVKNLELLQIPSDFPLHFSALSPDTYEFCHSEGVKTLGEFTEFAESMAQNILVGGDFKELLNALIMKDELTIARHLPFRPNEKGVHLIEALGIMTKQLEARERYSLLKRYGKKLTSDQAALSELDDNKLIQIEEQLSSRTEELVRYFANDAAEISRLVESGTSLERCLIVLNDEEAEIIGASFLKNALGCNKRSPSGDTNNKRRGFFSRLFGRR